MNARPMAAAAVVAFVMGTGAAGAATVNNAAYLYKGPGYNYATIMPIPGGATIGLGECPGDWCAATYGGRSGWIHKSLVYGGGGAVQATGGTTMGTHIGVGSHRRSRFSPLGMALSGGGHRRGGGGGNGGNQGGGGNFSVGFDAIELDN